MDNLLSSSGVGEYTTECTSQQYQSNQKSAKSKNGMRVGPIIAPGIDSPENDDFFLHGPQAPILNLDNADLAQEIDPRDHQSASSTSLPRSKSVRFEELDEKDRLKRVKGQVYEVTEKMRDNVARLLDREASLDSLADLSDQVQNLNLLFVLIFDAKNHLKGYVRQNGPLIMNNDHQNRIVVI